MSGRSPGDEPSPLAYPQADSDAIMARHLFRWMGGAKLLQNGATVTFRPWTEAHEPWTWRYGTAAAGTGSRYAALVTRVHHDVATREGGEAIVTVLSPWQDAHALSLGGWLDESYVAEHLTAGCLRAGNLNAGDLAALTILVRILLDGGTG